MKLWGKYQNGQTLAEVVVAIGVVVLLVTGLIIGTSVTLKASQYGKARSQAAQYAQEAVEMARALRDSSWTTFFSYSGTSQCLSKTGEWTTMSVSCPFDIDAMYARTVTFTWRDDLSVTNDERMKVDVVVSWTDGAKAYTAPLTTYFTQWK